MISKLNTICSFVKEEEGATAVEYAIMLALIILVCIGSVRVLGGSANNLWGGNLHEVLTSFSN